MTETAETEQQGAPVRSLGSTIVTQILGHIAVDDAEVQGNGAANNTRWVFDVECEAGKEIRISLLEHRSGRLEHPDLMSYSLAPTSAEFYEARPFAVYDQEVGVLTLASSSLPEEEPLLFSCRISIDVMHSATR